MTSNENDHFKQPNREPTPACWSIKRSNTEDTADCAEAELSVHSNFDTPEYDAEDLLWTNEQLTPCYIARKARELILTDSLIVRENNVRELLHFHPDDLEIGKLLGSGSFNDVFMIDDMKCSGRMLNSLKKKNYNAIRDHGGTSHQNNSCVIKRMRPGMIQNKIKYLTAIKDSITETYILASLCHENIVKIRGVVDISKEETKKSWLFRQDEGYQIIIEHVHFTLEDKLKEWRTKSRSFMGMRNKIKKETLCSKFKLVYQVAVALDYLHGHKVIYRDIKPGNIGLDLDGNVKIFDFGVAKELHACGMNEDGLYNLSLAGTVFYMAPEMLRSEGYNLKADVYSYGVLLWEVFTLKKAFEGWSGRRMMLHAKGNQVFLKMTQSTNKTVKSLFENLCSFDVKNRPTFEKIRNDLREECDRFG